MMTQTSSSASAPPALPVRNAGAPPVFQVRQVSKIFSSRTGQVEALRDVSFDFADGSFTCIVGPSGCGKSTLLRILGGLETATYGEITVNLPKSRVPQSAFVFQEHGVFPWFDVLDNVTFGQRMAGVGKVEREDVARRWIAEVGLTGFEHAYPHQLSGGMRQRIAIARAFATGSPSLLMDEPLGALDAQTRMLMQEQLVRLWEAERKTVVLVTHSIEEALLLGDQIIVMSARPGRIKEVIDVPFGRPRDVSIEGTERFAQMRQSIWESLRDEVQASMRYS
ncbi:ABC transporter ATP-binding protein [Agromyces bauzanensis]